MSCEDCLNRRTFLAKSAVAAAAAALATGCGDGVFGPPLPTHGAGGVPSGTVTITVADFPGLATAGVLVQVQLERAVVRTDPAAPSFRALSLICTHQGCDAAVTTTNIIECPCHGSRYDNTGAVINGPATQALAVIPSSYNPQTDELTIG
ncbi:MAG TPA: Rieske (2Fe-2S) protein [Gemmatimonadaceae bacterium]